MDEHSQRARTFLHGALSFALKGMGELWAGAMARKKLTFTLISICVIGGIVVSFFVSKPTDVPQDERPSVSLLRVGDLSAGEPVTLIGSVRSTSEAQVAADMSGQITAVYHNIGDYVSAGSIVAEIKNDAQRAAVAQARASLMKVENSTGASEITLGSTQESLAAAQQNAKTSIESAYSTIADIVHRQSDQMFINPDSTNPTLTILTANSQAKLNAESDRLSLDDILAREKTATAPSEFNAQLTELALLGNEAAKIAAFLSDLSAALNNAIPSSSADSSSIAAYRLTINGALSTVNALRTSLATTADTLKSKQAAVAAGQTSLSANGGATNPDVAAAQASLAAAQAQYEHTILRAPISGTINRLDLDVGSFVSPGNPVLYISNPHGLEVQAFLSERDLGAVRLGATALVGGVATGTVVRAANALDPTTRKAEIRIALPAGAPLVGGQSATVVIARSLKKGATATLSIPLAAVKITPEGAVVFGVENGKLKSNPVIVGTLRGARVDIVSGVSADTQIVSDARGLKDGESVIVK